MTKQDLKEAALKKEIGLRFKQFRKSIKKSQSELANELKVPPAKISSIETGKCFPGFDIQNYLHCQYHLNINWLLIGKGEIFIPPDKDAKNSELPIQFNHIDKNDPRYEKYVELRDLLSIPVIEKVIFAKLAEIKVLAKKEIDSFFEQK